MPSKLIESRNSLAPSTVPTTWDQPPTFGLPTGTTPPRDGPFLASVGPASYAGTSAATVIPKGC